VSWARKSYDWCPNDSVRLSRKDGTYPIKQSSCETVSNFIPWVRVRAPHSAHSSATTAPPSQPRERSSNIFIESPRQQQAEHLVVFPQQVGSDRRREACNTPKEVLVARWSLGVTALQQAFLDNLEHTAPAIAPSAHTTSQTNSLEYAIGYKLGKEPKTHPETDRHCPWSKYPSRTASFVGDTAP